MNAVIKKYMSKIGKKGGLKSRRTLDPETARLMVDVREARRAFKQFYSQCFWSSPIDYIVKSEDIQWVAKQIMTHGGREGWIIGAKLCR
jgi:hypothetical protein